MRTKKIDNKERKKEGLGVAVENNDQIA